MGKFWTPSKWIYTAPFMQNMKIFEMPVADFLGFCPNVIELRDLIFKCKNKSSFLECSDRVTALKRIITDDALHIFPLIQ
jgi:hypothetical protein